MPLPHNHFLPSNQYVTWDGDALFLEDAECFSVSLFLITHIAVVIIGKRPVSQARVCAFMKISEEPPNGVWHRHFHATGQFIALVVVLLIDVSKTMGSVCDGEPRLAPVRYQLRCA